jgi:acyl carrier protein
VPISSSPYREHEQAAIVPHALRARAELRQLRFIAVNSRSLPTTFVYRGQSEQSMSDIAREVIAQIAAVLGEAPERITRDASLVQDLGADSLDSVVLVLAIEDRFAIDMHDEDVEQLRTVQQLIEYVELAVTLATPARRPQEHAHGTGNRYYRP